MCRAHRFTVLSASNRLSVQRTILIYSERSKNPQARARARVYRATKQRQRSNPDPRTSIGYMRRLENRLRSVISMKMDRDNESTIRNCNLQQQSPLCRCDFAIIEKIFEFALSQSQDEKEPYPQNVPYRRPGHHAPRHFHTSLLLTCRRAWLEFNHIPMSSATHFFWFFNGPPGTLTSVHQFSQYFQQMTPRDLETIKHVQLFTSSHWIEGIGPAGTFNPLFGYEAFSPETLTVTMRHVDWKGYGSNAPLTFMPDWVKQFLHSQHMTRVKRFELELETVLHKEDQLDAIVQTLKDMPDLTKIHDAHDNDPRTRRPLGWQFKLSGPPQKSNWDDSAAQDCPGNKQYVVVKMTWNCISVLLKVELPSSPASENKQIKKRKHLQAFKAARKLRRREKASQRQEQLDPGLRGTIEQRKPPKEKVIQPSGKCHVSRARGGRRSQGTGIQISKTERISDLDYARSKTSDKWAREMSLLQLKYLPLK